MIFLLASIVSSTAIYVIFRWAKNYSCRLKPLITINYLTATLLGFGFLLHFNLRPFLQFSNWMPYGISLGVFYIIMFFLIGKSSQKAGITITTLANKLSLVFALNNMLIVALSATIGFFIFRENLNRINVLGLILAFISLYILL